MAEAVIMPKWGMIMEEGVVVSWEKKIGDSVQAGDYLAEIESEKVTNEIEAPASGVLARILVAEGESSPVGAPLAVIAAPEESEDEIAAFVKRLNETTMSVELGRERAVATNEVPGTSSEKIESRRLISPAAKRIAETNGVSYSGLTGSGPRGRIQVKDINNAIVESRRGIQSSGGTTRPLTSTRRAIARRTTRSIEAPQAGLFREIDLHNLIEFRESSSNELSLTALILYHVVRSIEAVPEINSWFDGETHTIQSSIHLGVVVSIDGGVAVPVIRDAQNLRFKELDSALKAMVKRSEKMAFTSEELEGSTFTVSNAGMLGIDLITPLLNPPETAALGIGRIKRRPTIIEENVVPRSTAFFCVATDHRVIDAEPAGRFLSELDSRCNSEINDEQE